MNLVSSSNLISHSAITSEICQSDKDTRCCQEFACEPNTLGAQTADLVSIVRLVGEAKGHAEGVVVLLQEDVSVPVLVQARHGVLELLQPPAEVLLGPRPTGEVCLHDLAQGEVVPCVRTLIRGQTLRG